jgi:N-hydroxyarylamine O-acetyltransferase
VLRAIGYTVKEATGRVRWGMPPEVRMPRTHCLLIVEAEGERYLADVGFGGNVLTGPLRLEAREAQATPHEQFRLVDEANGIVAQEVLVGDKWLQTYAFDFAEAHPADLELGNWYTSAHPNSLFVNGILGARAEEGRRYGLRDNQLSVHTLGGGTEKTTLASARELRDALTDLFKLRLEGLTGLDAKLARLAEATS